MISKLVYGVDLPTWALLLELAIAGAIVIWSGSKLTRSADALGDHLNLTGGWIGLILLATVTSLPELMTSGTAVWIGNVDMAFGGILGSCAFNVAIIVLLNALIGGGSVLRSVSPAHTLSSSFGLFLIATSLIGLLVAEKFAGRPVASSLFEWSWAAVIFATYLGCIRLSYRFERRTLGPTLVGPAEGPSAGPDVGPTFQSVNLPVGPTFQSVNPAVGPTVQSVAAAGRSASRRLYARVFFLAAIIVTASWWLAVCGDILSVHEIKTLGRPLGATFVGACFLALATSLPEITTSIAAVRIGSMDLALGNIFGSNMFNIFVIPWLKLVAFTRGELLLAPDAVNIPQNLIVGLLAMLLTAIAVGGLTYKSTRQMFRRFGFDAVMIAAAYVGGMILLLIGS